VNHIRATWTLASIQSAVLILAVVMLYGCSVVTPRIDDFTGTTLEQRCIDYVTLFRAYDAVSVTRILDPTETAIVIGVKTALALKCPAQLVPADVKAKLAG